MADANGSLRAIVRTGACPEPGLMAYVRVVRATHVRSIRGYFLGDAVLGVELHWDAARKRDFPCAPDRLSCKACREGFSTHWKGFIAGAIWPERGKRIVEITAGAFRNSPELKAMDGRLRGAWFQLTRLVKHKNNAPARIEVISQKRVDAPEPSFDMLPILLNLWGVQAMHEVNTN